jgi:hypothetical protein
MLADENSNALPFSPKMMTATYKERMEKKSDPGSPFGHGCWRERTSAEQSTLSSQAFLMRPALRLRN